MLLPIKDWTSEPGFIIYYHGFPNFGGGIVKSTFAIESNTVPQLVSQDTKPLPNDYESSFVAQSAMNPVAQNEFVITLIQDEDKELLDPQRIAHTRDGGDNFIDYSADLSDVLQAIIWSADGRYIYAVDASGDVARCRDFICEYRGTLPGGDSRENNFPRHLAVDTSNRDRLFAVTSNRDDFYNPRVVMSENGGRGWRDITGEGSLVETSSTGGAVTYIVDRVAVGTSNGVLVPNETGEEWELLAPGLPKVPIYDMVYDPTDDRLIIATLGRGVW